MDQTNHILEYWSKIQAGEIVACKRLKQQYAKLVDELHNPRDPWVFDLAKANAPIEFIERFCRHSKGKWVGQPVKLELFQKAKFQAIFGFVHKETGFRRCREVLTVEARKTGRARKWPGWGFTCLVGDGEGGPEIVSLATKRDQARIVFNEATNMVGSRLAAQAYSQAQERLVFPGSVREVRAIGIRKQEP